jgi:hypothetical protein
MSSEHAIEQVPLTEIHEGDTIQDPKSGNWTTIVGTDSGTTSVIHRYSDGSRRSSRSTASTTATKVRSAVLGYSYS